MSKNHVIVSRWLIGIIIAVLLAVIPMSAGIIYNQGQQSKTIEFIADSVSQIKDIVKRLADQDVVLAKHEQRIINIERELYGKETTKTEKAR